MTRAQRTALWACLAAGFATLLDATTISYTAPPLIETFSPPTGQVQWFLASYSLTFGLGLVPSGRLGDAFGRRRLFVAGLLVFFLGGVVVVLAPTVTVVVVGRLVQGLGAGFVSAQVLGVIQDMFTADARIRAFAAYTAAGAAAGFLGPIAAGVILTVAPSELAWRLILLAPLPFTLIAVAFGLAGLARTDVRRARVDLDIPGIALLGTVVVLVMLPVIEPGLGTEGQIVVLGIATIAVVALVVWERRYTARGRLALFTPVLIRSRGFVVGNLVALLWFGALLAQGAVMTVYLLQATGIPSLSVAAVFLPGALARLLVSLVSRRIFLRWGIAALVGGLVAEAILTGLLATVVPGGQTGVVLTVTALISVGLGAAGAVIEPPLRAITLSHASGDLHGVAASFLQLSQRLSATYAVALATGILLGITGVPTPPQLRAALVVCALAVAVAAVVAVDGSVRLAAQRLRAGVSAG